MKEALPPTKDRRHTDDTAKHARRTPLRKR
jgi:hypothetical protein